MQTLVKLFSGILRFRCNDDAFLSNDQRDGSHLRLQGLADATTVGRRLEKELDSMKLEKKNDFLSSIFLDFLTLALHNVKALLI